MANAKTLILAGGQSSRMGTPKHLLPLPSTMQPLYQHLIRVVHAAAPETEVIYLSIADSSKLDDTLRSGTYTLSTNAGPTNIKLVKIPDRSPRDIGPAAGLLAAHRYDPDANWLVVACDFPLLEPAALQQLKMAFEEPVTCFTNKQGFCEPFLAIWSPHALQSLSESVDTGRTGPSYTVKHLGGKVILPKEDEWLLNTNTPEEWNAARTLIKPVQSEEGI
ncbi:hypothetical protein E8E13_007462 [Curvularia kusanoi]|uniref:MobA-like NTP transferase domain-containing protein n=1 Tax=Curvularia kusanoi TaxID=90978 RepID=A0A9P4W6R3_CURKU|nr:hypothetical protein E8E13_007462 [Curvularia kusanoi]